MPGTKDDRRQGGRAAPGPDARPPGAHPATGPGPAPADASADAPAPAASSPPEAPAGTGLAALLAPVRGRLALAVVLQAVAALASVVPFIAVAELGRVLLDPGPGGEVDRDRAWWVAGTGAAAMLTGLALTLAAGALTHLADNDLSLALRRRLAAHLGRVPLGWFTDRNSGLVRKAVHDDVSAMHHLVGHTLTDITRAAVVPLASVAYLFVMDWRLTLVTLVPVVIGLALYGRMAGSASARANHARYDEALARVGAASVEFAHGITVVKTFGRARRAHRRFTDATDALSAHFLDWVRGMMRTGATVELILSPVFLLLWILGVGVLFVSRGWVEAVDLLPFALLGLGLTAPVLGLGYSAEDVRKARQAADRVGAILATPALPEPAPGGRATADGTTVEFDRVSFGYDDRSRALDEVSLTLRPGSVTALVGPSGSGKTTLARLLPRFYDVTGGAIRIGGADLRELPAAHLYRLVSFVFQDVQLLRASVRENLTLARPDATDEEVASAARAAQIHDRILELPDGYDTVVGEGALFSGGEAQRLSIARALLADTPVLVLDEATAFADPESEAAIQEALSRLVVGRTLLVIAHRLATISGADQIAVLERGRIVERGTHAELLALGDRYARSWAIDERSGQEGPAVHPAPAPRPADDPTEATP
ncbi:ABC transporter ATP-binding protein [Streptomyces sp. NPDC127068]|uniref:ABC transporter ATP-binding protein n=1 Tax=Streptomyces sp. NPDC127068 TaxID=3347127 RepID=UPI00366601A7